MAARSAEEGERVVVGEVLDPRCYWFRTQCNPSSTSMPSCARRVRWERDPKKLEKVPRKVDTGLLDNGGTRLFVVPREYLRDSLGRLMDIWDETD